MKLWLKVVISITTALFILPVMSIAYDVLYAIPSLDAEPPWLRPYIELEPFFATVFGKLAIAVWVLLAALWIAYGALRLRKVVVSSRILSRVAIIGIFVGILSLSLFRLSIVKAEYNLWNVVDVLTIYDEEFLAHQDWVSNANSIVGEVSASRFEDSNISLVIRGLFTWNSNDSERDPYFLMQDALLVSNLPKEWIQVDAGVWSWSFVSGSEWTDDRGNVWRIDLLMMFTGQDCSHQALSLPMCNMMIFNHDAARNFRTVTHELGHQYWLEHCGDAYCAMDDRWMWGDDFCVRCRGLLNSRRDKWETDPVFFMHNSFMPPQGETNPAGGHYYQRAEGSSVTIEAFPYDGSIFERWVISHRLYQIEYEEIYSNPYTFAIMNAEYDIFPMYAYSKTLSLSAVGGGTTDPLPGIHKFTIGEAVSIEAVCFTGLKFENWQYDGTTETRNPMTVTMDADHFLQANFKADDALGMGCSGGLPGHPR